MKERCTNPKHPHFKGWGGRGITICDSWLNSFESFYEDMGHTYQEGLTLDRRDNERGYSPDNCRWVGYIVQANNTRSNKFYNLSGEVDTLHNLCRKYNKNYDTVRKRLYKGMGIIQAFEYKKKA